MVNLNQLPENINITVTKKDLMDLVNNCLNKCNIQQAKHYSEHLTIKELADYLSYSPPAIYKMVGQAEIPSYKLNGKLLFKKSEIDDWLLDFKQPTIKSRIAELDNKKQIAIFSHRNRVFTN